MPHQVAEFITDDEIVAALEDAGVHFMSFPHPGGKRMVCTTAGSQDTAKVVAGVRLVLARLAAAGASLAHVSGKAVPLTVQQRAALSSAAKFIPGVTNDKETCTLCGQSWDDHDFGVPMPFCPGPAKEPVSSTTTGAQSSIEETVHVRATSSVARYAQTRIAAQKAQDALKYLVRRCDEQGFYSPVRQRVVIDALGFLDATLGEGELAPLEVVPPPSILGREAEANEQVWPVSGLRQFGKDCFRAGTAKVLEKLAEGEAAAVGELHVFPKAPAEFYFTELGCSVRLEPDVYPLYLRSWAPQAREQIRNLVAGFELSEPAPSEG